MQGRAEGRSPSAFFSIPQDWGIKGGLKPSMETTATGADGMPGVSLAHRLTRQSLKTRTVVASP